MEETLKNQRFFGAKILTNLSNRTYIVNYINPMNLRVLIKSIGFAKTPCYIMGNSKKKRVVIYIDGSNFYFSVKKTFRLKIKIDNCQISEFNL